MLWIFSSFYLLATSAICLGCLFDKETRKGVFQCLGMIILIFACLGRAKDIIAAGSVNPIWVPIHFGVFVYAFGAALHIVLRRVRDSGWPLLLRFDDWVFKQRSARAVRHDAARRARHEAERDAARDHLAESWDAPRSQL